MQYVIRRAEIGDVDDLSDLFHDFIDKDSNKDKMREQLLIMNENSNYYVAVADDGNKVIGTATGIICYDLVGECGAFMLVENVVISSDYHRNGIGRALMNSIEGFGIKNQCKYVILVSESARKDSHEFYKAIGYATDQKGFKKSLK